MNLSPFFILVFIISGFIADVTTPLVKNYLVKYEIFDKPDSRKVHKGAIPRIGGIAIFLGFFTGTVFSYIFFYKSFTGQEFQLAGLICCGILLVILGIVDDIKNLRASYKLFFQIVIACLMILFDYKIDSISIPFTGPILLGWLSYPATIFWIISIINAINLIDGLDGLASGVSLIVGVTILILSIYFGTSITILLSIAFIGSILGFIRHNFHPATIFMGDTGSMLLGFLIASMGIVGSQKTAVSFAIATPIVALGYPLLDTILAIFRRVKAKRHIFSPDREHIHHILLSYGYSHKKSVFILYGICLFFAAMALLLAISVENQLYTIGILSIVSIFAVTFLKILAYIKTHVNCRTAELMPISETVIKGKSSSE